MTRHGTLAYYLAAWVIGCPVVALVFWLIESVQTDQQAPRRCSKFVSSP